MKWKGLYGILCDIFTNSKRKSNSYLKKINSHRQCKHISKYIFRVQRWFDLKICNSIFCFINFTFVEMSIYKHNPQIWLKIVYKQLWWVNINLGLHCSRVERTFTVLVIFNSLFSISYALSSCSYRKAFKHHTIWPIIFSIVINSSLIIVTMPLSQWLKPKQTTD